MISANFSQAPTSPAHPRAFLLLLSFHIPKAFVLSPPPGGFVRQSRLSKGNFRLPAVTILGDQVAGISG